MTPTPGTPPRAQRSEGLVLSEGMDFGSTRFLDDDTPPAGDVRAGGRPEAAPDRFDHPAEDLLGPPEQDGDGPGQTQSVD
ncbi:MAG TPA: hypothetical protein VK908_06475 [Jiangellales bacterium]|nr:hypothetical protein [Jiangellales bacterium]